MKTSLILCLLSATVCFAQLTVTAKDTVVHLGSSVSISCNYETDDDDTTTSPQNDSTRTPDYRWYKVTKDGENFKLLSLKEGVSNFTDPVALQHGMTLEANGNLNIPDATWDIAENFTKLACEVELGPTGLQTSQTITLQVIAAPDPDAEIITDLTEGGENGFDITEISTSVGSCTSPPSFPAASINFIKNGKELKSPIADSTIAEVFNAPTEEKSSDGHRIISRKNLYKTLDKSDHAAEFMCNVKVEYNGHVYFEKNQSLPAVNVKYATDMVEWEETPNAYLGETITLRCEANGFPEATISINDEVGAEKEITITSEMDGMSYQCSARNSLSQAEVQSSVYTITILSADEPVISGDDYVDGVGTVQLGESATFECASSGNPEPTVAWYDKNDAKLSDTGTLTFEEAMLSQTGKYTCKSFVDGHEKLGRSTTLDLDVRGMTITGDAKEVKQGEEGSTVHLDCGVNANPKPTFTWDFEDAKPTETKTQQHKYTSQVSVGPLNSDLSKKVFTCTATNEDKTVTKQFIMPEIASASGATTGIIIAILLIILIVAIVVAVLYNKGIICKKGEKGDESAEGDIALEINNDDGDVEAGNGKPAAPAAEENERVENPEEEKLMNGDEVEK